jgi:LPS-assembly protein
MVCLGLCAGAVAYGAEEPVPWLIESQDSVVYDLNTGIAMATNGIIVRHGDTVLSAQRAIINQVTGEISAEGNVRLEHAGLLYAAERVRYNLHQRRLVAEEIKTGIGPMYVGGEVLVGDLSNRVYVVGNGLLTTDDYAQPGYSIRAKTLTIMPGEYIEAQQATVCLGHTPVFYVPKFRRNLQRDPNHWTFTPGYRSRYGAFLFSGYHWAWNDQLRSGLELDAYTKRGLGVAPDLSWQVPGFGSGQVKYYYIHDLEPGQAPDGSAIAPDRQRVYFWHLGTLRTNLTVRSVVAWQSDAQIIRDFFESEYHRNAQPNSFVELEQAWPNYSLHLLVQPRVNDFWQAVQRLPELRLRGYRQQVGSSPFYYDSDSSLGYYEQKFPDDPSNLLGVGPLTNLPYAALRFDSYHQITLPHTFFNWLNVAPRIGGRFTHYGEAIGPGGVTSAENRGVFNAGIEVSFKASRLWPGVQSRWAQIDGLRHIIEPSVNYTWVPEPNVRPHRLPQFDSELPTTVLLPIQFPDYNAVDAIDRRQVLRLGLRNKLQTKRAGTLDHLLDWSVFTDWRLTRASGQSTFAPIYSVLDLKLLAWLTLSSGLRVNTDTARLDETEHHLTLTPNDKWSFGVGHHHLDDYPGVPNQTGYRILRANVYYRLDQNWAVRGDWLRQSSLGTYHHYLLSLYRDFRSWTGAVSFRLRDNPTGPNDYTVAVTFSLKAMPRYGLGEDVTRPTLLLGH